MLVITRRPGEELIIGDNIKVIALGVRGNQIRLGIEAPEDIKIMRTELLTRKKLAE